MTLSALSPNAAARCRSRVVGVLTKPMLCACWTRRRLYARSDSFIVMVYMMMLYAVFLYVNAKRGGANVFFHRYF